MWHYPNVLIVQYILLLTHVFILFNLYVQLLFILIVTSIVVYCGLLWIIYKCQFIIFVSVCMYMDVCVCVLKIYFSFYCNSICTSVSVLIEYLIKFFRCLFILFAFSLLFVFDSFHFCSVRFNLMMMRCMIRFIVEYCSEIIFKKSYQQHNWYANNHTSHLQEALCECRIFIVSCC